jgi:hypothetical protein
MNVPARRFGIAARAAACGLLMLAALGWIEPAPAKAPAVKEPAAILEIGRLSAEREGAGPPSGWKPLTFRNIERHTRYSLVRDAGTTVLRADSEASASGLVREQTIDLKEFPIIEWRWRVGNVLSKADVKTRAGDDYPVRLYITFAHDANSISLADRAARAIYGQLPPRAAINYIWDTRAPVGTIVPNAYTDRVRMIVVESGSARVGEWITYRRNLAEDFRKAFGYEPPLVSGIAVMTDTDNTGESATAFYGDIFLRRANVRSLAAY